MANKQVALGTLLKTDAITPAAFANQTLVDAITYPGRTREEIEGKDLGDDLDVPLLGIESASRMVFNQYWEPGDTQHEALDTKFDDKGEFSAQIVSSHDTPVTDEFTCKCVGLEPEQLTTNGTYKRQVTLLRTGDTTRT